MIRYQFTKNNMSKVHIVFGVYSRISYFKRCLNSIKDQITYHDVSLVIDGPKDSPGVIENINLFKHSFKDKYENIDDRIFVSEKKIGAEHNIIRSFKIGFETSDCDYVIFIEDDIEFNNLYLEQMELLWNFVKDYDEISTFSCYSRDCLYYSDELLEQYKNCLLTQYHQYGTGIKRKYYNDTLKSLMNEYLENTEEDMINDSFKNIEKVINTKYGIYPQPEKTHWDIYYCMVSYSLGYYRVSTCLNYCKHIGIDGLDCNSDLYKIMFKDLENEKYHSKNLIYNFIFDRNLNKYNQMIQTNNNKKD